MHARRTRIFFPEQECDLVTVLVCMTKSSFVTEKKCVKCTRECLKLLPLYIYIYIYIYIFYIIFPVM